MIYMGKKKLYCRNDLFQKQNESTNHGYQHFINLKSKMYNDNQQRVQ